MSVGQNELPTEFQEMIDNPNVDDPFGAFSDAAQTSAHCIGEMVKVDGKHLHQLARQLCQNGVLVYEINSTAINWSVGLETLCNPESVGNLGAAATWYEDRCAGLYRRWRDLDGSIENGPNHQETRLTGDRLEAATRLAPDLPIENREYLSETYLQKVLKPYAQAKYSIRQTLWSDLQRGHEVGFWLCFVPSDDGTYGLLTPGAGFDKMGSYQINRAAFLKGLNASDTHVDTLNYPDQNGYERQDRWHFIGADHPAIQSFIENPKSGGRLAPINAPKIEYTGEPGRPTGSIGYPKDTMLAEVGLKLLETGEAGNARDAARKAFNMHRPELDGYNEDRTPERVARLISKEYKSRT
ncbi:MAG: hypothetical protein AAFQ12_12835 [Pseudomonadota bacterium]